MGVKKILGHGDTTCYAEVVLRVAYNGANWGVVILMLFSYFFLYVLLFLILVVAEVVS